MGVGRNTAFALALFAVFGPALAGESIDRGSPRSTTVCWIPLAQVSDFQPSPSDSRAPRGIARFSIGPELAIPLGSEHPELSVAGRLEAQLEYQHFRGIWIAVELNPFRFSDPLTTSLHARLKLGFSHEKFAIGGHIADGVWDGHLIKYPDFGHVTRIGRLTGSHVYFRSDWLIIGKDWPFWPVGGQILINIALTEFWNLHLDAQGGYWKTPGIDSCIGAQYLTSRKPGRRAHVVTFGAGVSAYPFYVPGLSFRLKYEIRW